jgi:hypothetical protein
VRGNSTQSSIVLGYAPLLGIASVPACVPLQQFAFSFQFYQRAADRGLWFELVGICIICVAVAFLASALFPATGGVRQALGAIFSLAFWAFRAIANNPSLQTNIFGVGLVCSKSKTAVRSRMLALSQDLRQALGEALAVVFRAGHGEPGKDEPQLGANVTSCS